MKKILFLGLLLAFGFFQNNSVLAQCSPDIEPPTPVLNLIESFVLQGGTIEVWASDFDTGSFDNCPGDLQFSFSSDVSDESQVFDCSNLGNNALEVWVTDEAGNQVSTNVTLVILGNPSPTLVCNSVTVVGVPSGGTVTVLPEDILEGGPYCLPANFSFQLELDPPSTPSPTLVFDETQTGFQSVSVGVYDASGTLGNACWGIIEVTSCGTNTPPVAVCDEAFAVSVLPGETTTVSAETFDDGSWDSCTPQNDLMFTVEVGLPPSPTAPTATSVTFDEDDGGYQNVILWVGDADGAWNQCIIEVAVSVKDCDDDTQAPFPYCENGVQTELPSGASEVEIWATDFDINSFDNCTANADLEFRIENASTPSATPPATENLTFSEGIYDIVMWVGDEAGNWDYCQTTLEVSPCIGLTTLTCNNLVQVSLPPGDGADFLPEYILEGGPYCATGGNYFAMQFNPPSTPMPVIPLTAADAGEHLVSVGLYDADDNLISECWGNIDVWAWSLVKGRVFADTLADCIYDIEPNLAGQPVQGIGMVTGTIYETVTDIDGFYALQTDVEDNEIQVSLPLGFNYGGSCGTTYTANFPVGTTDILIIDIPVQLNNSCPLLSVDIGANTLRRCFENDYYVNYCNLSDQPINDVSIEVTLDDYMEVQNTTIPGTQLDDVTWSFEIGTLEPGECNQFSIHFLLSCDAPLSYTHCVNAHIMPDTICPEVPTFTGSNIEVEGYCENDSIYLDITNTGSAAMATSLDYIVVQDVIMLQGGPFNLGPGATMSLAPIFAENSTYRLEAPQEPGHPYGGVAAIAFEGCGDAFTPGFVNLFPMNSSNPFTSTDCQENTGSYDPNDKRAFPVGYGAGHFIEKNIDIDYQIRFQNTGTDTAFNVVILDTLSQHLDAVTLRPGASSHQYNFELLEDNIARFTFPNIMLPDSNVNVALSQGFVKFQISQMPDLELETVIENSAAIYFDFNEPVITNTVFHTIGEHFIQVISNTDERPVGLEPLSVYPNPSFGTVNFELPADAPDGAVFQLHDHLGRTVSMEQFTGGKYRFERGALAPGVYFYSIDIQSVGRYSGKVILK